MATLTVTAAPAPTSALRRAIARHALVSLFGLIYVLEWLFLVPAALDSHGLLPFHIPDFVQFFAGWMPAVAAIIVVGAAEGRAGVGRLFRRFLIWRVNPAWYILALFGMAAAMLAGVWIYGLVTGTMPVLPVAGASFGMVIFAFVVTLVLGMILNTEEMAWRGVALPRLQAGRSTLLASLILGVVEGLTHLPLGWTQGMFVSQVGVGWFMLFSFAVVILYSWIFNNTKGSLLIVTMLHASQNAWSNLVSPADPGPFYVTVGLFWAAVVVVLLVNGPARLSRKPESELPIFTGEDGR